MTNEEAREVLQQIRKQKCATDCNYSCKLYKIETFCLEEKALDMAIKAPEDKGYEQGYADGFADCLELNT